MTDGRIQICGGRVSHKSGRIVTKDVSLVRTCESCLDGAGNRRTPSSWTMTLSGLVICPCAWACDSWAYWISQRGYYNTMVGLQDLLNSTYQVDMELSVPTWGCQRCQWLKVIPYTAQAYNFGDTTCSGPIRQTLDVQATIQIWKYPARNDPSILYARIMAWVKGGDGDDKWYSVPLFYTGIPMPGSRCDVEYEGDNSYTGSCAAIAHVFDTRATDSPYGCTTYPAMPYGEGGGVTLTPNFDFTP